MAGGIDRHCGLVNLGTRGPGGCGKRVSGCGSLHPLPLHPSSLSASVPQTWCFWEMPCPRVAWVPLNLREAGGLSLFMRQLEAGSPRR